MSNGNPHNPPQTPDQGVPVALNRIADALEESNRLRKQDMILRTVMNSSTSLADLRAYARSQGIPLGAALKKHLERIMREFDA